MHNHLHSAHPPRTAIHTPTGPANSMLHEIRCNSAAELLARLDPSDPVWRSGPRNRWVFRGQRRADWPLVPKAFRYDAILDPERPAEKGPRRNIKAQVLAEYKLVRCFLHLADEIGMPVPGDGPFFRTLETESILHAYFQWPCHDAYWPPAEYMQPFALAQHHGIPTRLLDVTYSPLKALLFATLDASSSPSPESEEYLAVWAVDTDFLKIAWSDNRLVVVTVPRGTNTYLHAQDGLFLLHLHANFNLQRGDPPTPWDDMIAHAIRPAIQQGKWTPGAHPLVKLTAPWSTARHCLSELSRRGITKAHIMPDLRSVAEWLYIEPSLPIEADR